MKPKSETESRTQARATEPESFHEEMKRLFVSSTYGKTSNSDAGAKTEADSKNATQALGTQAGAFLFGFMGASKRFSEVDASKVIETVGTMMERAPRFTMGLLEGGLAAWAAEQGARLGSVATGRKNAKGKFVKKPGRGSSKR